MNDDLDAFYQKAQKYLEKNILDLQIPLVAEAIGLGSTQSRTPCRNFWSARCEVSHAAIRLHIADEYGDFTFDPAAFMEIYTCSGYWALNFLVPRPQEPLTEQEEADLRDKALQSLLDKVNRYDYPDFEYKPTDTRPSVFGRVEKTMRSRLSSNDETRPEKESILSTRDREVIDNLRAIQEKSQRDYASRLTVLGVTRLWKIAKSPIKDASWLRELVWEVGHRTISLFDPRVKIAWDATYYHEPFPDPYLEPTPVFNSYWIKRSLDCIEKLNRFFYTRK